MNASPFAEKQRTREKVELLAMPVEGRPPPHSLEDEAFVVGSVLIDAPSFLGPVRQIVKPEDFYSEAHRRVFEAICDVADAGLAVDIPSVRYRLEQVDRLLQVGETYLREVLIGWSVNRLEEAEEHARAVAVLARRREALVAAQLFVAKQYIGPIVPSGAVLVEEVGSFTKEMEKIVAGATPDDSGFVSIGHSVLASFQEITEEQRSGQTHRKASGLAAWDKSTGGFFDSKLYVIAARPGGGKTSFLLSSAVHIAKTAGPVAIFSLEMKHQELSNRIVCARARVPFANLERREGLDQADWNRLTAECSAVSKLPIAIYDRGKPNFDQIRTKLLRAQSGLARRNDPRTGAPLRLQAVFLDYLTLMKFDLRNGLNLSQAIGEVTGGFKAIAKELDVPFVLLCQLNRASEQDVRPPRMSDLRDSGSIEQDADTIAFFHDFGEPTRREVIFGKNRSGPTGATLCGWDGPMMKFFDVQPEEEEAWRQGRSAARQPAPRRRGQA